VPPNQSSLPSGFLVRNSGTTTIINISIACTATGSVACVSVDLPYVASLTPGQSVDVEVLYATGSSGSGGVILTATGKTGAPASDTMVVTLLANPAVTLVAPVSTGPNRAVVRTRQPRVSARWVRGGNDADQAIDSTSIQLTWRGVDVTAQARFNRGVLEWEPDSAQGLGVVGSSAADSAILSLRVCAVNGGCTTVTPWVVLPSDQKPVLGFGGVPYEALGRAFGAPFGPGLAVTAGEVEAGVSTVPYYSRNLPRSTGLVYSTRQSYPRALVPVDVELTWPVGTPDALTVLLKDGSTVLDSVRHASPTCTTGGVRRCRVVLQGDFSVSSFPTPTRKWLRVEARVSSGGTTQSSVDSVEVVLVDRRATRYGAGWWPTAGVLLVSAGGDRLLVSATGAVSVFRGNGDSLFLSPPGSELLLKRSGASFELSARGSAAKTVFDTAAGRLRYTQDPNGNRDSVRWDAATDKILSVRDPVGRYIAFGYTGSGAFSTFTTTPGSNQRVTKVTIDAATNRLTRDSISSPAAAPYTTTYLYQGYPGTKTVVLLWRAGVNGDTTTVGYDSTARRRPVQVRLPRVQDASGAWVQPVISYMAREYQGIAAPRALDSAYVQLTDPRGFWTRSLQDRWGQATRTWDALGVLGRAAYLPDGRVLWTEGAVADSSRVWTQYDSLRRVVRTWWVRGAGDTLRLDSVAYDAQSRVIAQVDARGKARTVTYDAVGNPLRVVGPAQDTTFVWYLGDGRVDSTRQTGSTTVRYDYDLMWQNVAHAFGPSTQLLSQYLYDGQGRTSVTESALRVADSLGLTRLQWRKVATWYTVVNEVDSTVLYRGDNCTAPCYSMPSTFDSLHRQAVGYRRDRAGRDTARVDTRGKATIWRLDRLGRVVSRRPWADSAVVKDSLVYDLAGNVVKVYTRRGYLIATSYDSRNRDTLSVIPTVGTLRKAYGGPAGQLTRQWLENPVDSIGGVNGELRWGYDQRGRLRADTAWSGAVPRVQTYTYDAWERPATRTDAVGVWSTRYETNRGLPDTLLTPLGDSLTLVLDQLARVTALTARGPAGTPIHQDSHGWDLSGELVTASSQVNVFGSPTWSALSLERADQPDPPGPMLKPFWRRQAGPGAPLDSLRDSVVYDGWQRVIGWWQRSTLARDSAWADSLVSRSYTFDPMGNLFVTGSEVFNGTTNQLRKSGGFLTYDHAGNLTAKLALSWSYGYDALDRLIWVRKGGVLIARYGYDVAGRRIVKRTYSSSTGGTVGYLRMVYAGSQVSVETDSAGTALGTTYTWGPGVDNLLAVTVQGTTYRVVTDPLGSVRALVRRSDGAWIGSLRYDPYGSSLDSAGTLLALRYRWTGREWDAETGFYFHRSRYYDPAVGRFVQEDPVGAAGGSNPYAYVGGDVLRARDPGGLMADYSPYSWRGLCIGDYCWGAVGDPGPGGSGSSQRINALVAWAAMTSMFFDATYEEYLARWQDWKRMASLGKDTLAILIAGSDSLTEDQFNASKRALRQQLTATGNARFIEPLLEWLVSGRVMINTAAVAALGLFPIHPGFTVAQFTFYHGRTWEYYQFDSSRANLLVHEWAHYQGKSDCGPGRTAYQIAADLSGVAWPAYCP